MNYRELLNRVCRATGQGTIECSISALSDDNHILMGEFFNQFKDEVEAAHNWRALRQTVSVTINAGSDFGVINGIPRNARLVRVHDYTRFSHLQPLAFDVTDASQPFPLQDMDMSLIIYKNTMETTQGGNVQPIALALDPSDTEMRVRVYPKPTTVRTLQLSLTVPQAYLDVDDVATEVVVPHRALLIGTIWYVLEERGEELGQSSMFTEERYRTALADEVGIDSAEQGEYELVPV